MAGNGLDGGLWQWLVAGFLVEMRNCLDYPLNHRQGPQPFCLPLSLNSRVWAVFLDLLG